METRTTGSNGSAVEIEFELRDRSCFFVDASAAADCRVELEHTVNQSDDRLLEYVTVGGASPDSVLTMAKDSAAIDEGRLISRGVDGGLFEFVVTGSCVTTTLADTGAVTRAVAAEGGVGEILADVPAHVDVRGVVEQFRESHPESELRACRDSGHPIPIRSEQGMRATMAAQLTDKQLEVLRTAYSSGYFSWPRRTTAEECARALDISQPTFSQHIRAAQEKVIGGLFDRRDER